MNFPSRTYTTFDVNLTLAGHIFIFHIYCLSCTKYLIFKIRTGDAGLCRQPQLITPAKSLVHHQASSSDLLRQQLTGLCLGMHMSSVQPVSTRDRNVSAADRSPDGSSSDEFCDRECNRLQAYV
jgi:hypothetical protein